MALAGWAIALIVIVSILVGWILGSVIGGIVYRAMTRTAPATDRLDGKIVIVTGSSAGVGKMAALGLARRGARVIMACRNLKKAQPIADEIIRNSGNENVVVKHLDVSVMESVRTFAAEINEEEEHIHVLVNNAGILTQGKKKTSMDGFELTMATNHYGGFLLTILLIGKLKASAPSRVVNVSSSGHLLNVLDVDDLNYERRSFNATSCYCQTKLCNILFTKELSRRLKGSGVTVNALHPGFVNTEIFDKDSGFGGKISHILAQVCGRTVEQGSQTHIYLAASREVQDKSGGYYVNCKKETLRRKAADMDLAKELWDVTVKDLKLTETELTF